MYMKFDIRKDNPKSSPTTNWWTGAFKFAAGVFTGSSTIALLAPIPEVDHIDHVRVNKLWHKEHSQLCSQKICGQFLDDFYELVY